ncbi:hypothetical protein [Poritiphilus flavus]|uniref:DUF2953 domain-containing protein n=1 Tax=Poritiphilus flavus TaxID=2697053 RepID=A0A6L9EIV6_9FLAO|nr:hypothetical protein [Poritiphilus flavus]NAS14448.1 hypothetical protein [Poritiphilus flavus]
MMWLILGFALFLVLLISLLFAPIDLLVNTNKNKYKIRIKGLAKAEIEADESELLRIRLKVLFLKFYFYPLRKRSASKSKREVTGVTRKKKRQMPLKRGLKVLRSFRLKRLFLEIDTGNCISNARLYPLFALLNFYTDAMLHINYEGRNSLVMHVQNRPVNIIRSFIN